MSRVPAITFGAVLFSIAALGQMDDAGGPAAPVTIYTHFEQEHSAAAVAEMKSELAALMAPTGLGFEWRRRDSDHAGEVSLELVVVSFKGACRMDQLSQRRPETAALGWTHTSDGVVLPFSDVDCDRIRRFIGQRVRYNPPAERERLLGRAMGRVLAHELYHVFAGTMRHGKNGIAKADFTPNELVSNRFGSAEKESTSLRAAFLPVLTRILGRVPLATFAAKSAINEK